LSTSGRVLARRWLLLALCLSVLVGGCSSASTGSLEQRQQLEVTLASVQPSPAEVIVQLTNIGRSPIAVCPCIGPPHLFVVFDIDYGNEARSVPYPEVLFEGKRLRRFYECLEPGQSMDVKLDLSSWQPVWGEHRDETMVVDLFPGEGRYRARARYVDSGKRGWRRCRGFSGEVVSDWLSLLVPPAD